MVVMLGENYKIEYVLKIYFGRLVLITSVSYLIV